MNSTLPVLLLHGWGGSSRTSFISNGWGEALVGRPLLLEDLPGHGPASASVDPLDYSDLAGELALRLPAGPLDVIGYSLGAKLALRLASDRPQQFRRLVAIGVGDNAFAPERSAEAVASALECGITDETPAPVRALVDYSRASDSNPRALAAVLRRPPNPVQRQDEFKAIGARVLLINGSQDHIALPDEALQAALPNLTYVLLSGVSHIGLLAEGAVRNAAVRFLNSGEEIEISRTKAH